MPVMEEELGLVVVDDEMRSPGTAAAPPGGNEFKPAHIYDKMLYPFLAIDFEDTMTHVMVEEKESHAYATPEECDPCADVKAENAYLH